MSTRYDKRIEKVEAKLGEVGKLPLSARGPYPDFIGTEDREPDFSGIETKLMEKYGTIEGARFFTIHWGRPPVENESESDGVSGDPMQGCQSLSKGCSLPSPLEKHSFLLNLPYGDWVCKNDISQWESYLFDWISSHRGGYRALWPRQGPPEMILVIICFRLILFKLILRVRKRINSGCLIHSPFFVRSKD